MTAREHLAGLPAYVINMGRSAHRLPHLEEHVRPYVGSLTRVPGIDGLEIPEVEVRAFGEEADKFLTRYPGLRVPRRTSVGYWRGVMGCYLSHLRAIEMASLVHDRFLILEDDATFDLRAIGETEAPPGSARDLERTVEGVFVWGGARRGSYANKTRERETVTANRWSLIEKTESGVRQRAQTTAIEFSSIDVAERWSEIIRDNPQGYDFSWLVAMMEIDVYTTSADVIYQEMTLGSERSPGKNSYLASQ